MFEADLSSCKVTFGLPDYSVFSQDNIIAEVTGEECDCCQGTGNIRQIICCELKESVYVNATLTICPNCQRHCDISKVPAAVCPECYGNGVTHF